MKASPEDQAKLLDLQVLDRKIAGLKHQLASIPAAARVQEIKVEADELRTEIALATSARNDVTRALKQAEAEVEKVQERAKTQRQRLDSGELSPKEMERIQEELQQLAIRQGDLEDSALDAMDGVERATEKVNELEAKQGELDTELGEKEAEVRAAAGDIQGDLDAQTGQRNAVAQTLPGDLLNEYETCKQRTGGIGAVAVQGNETVGISLELSMAELSSLGAAAPDEVYVSEEHDVILVRR